MYPTGTRHKAFTIKDGLNGFILLTVRLQTL